MKLAATLVAVILLAGCSGLQTNPNQQQLANVGMQLVAYNVGYYVGKDRPNLDPQIRTSYQAARTGQLSPEAMNLALTELKVSDPLLVGNCMIALKAMGAGFAPTGQIVNLSAIPPETWDSAAVGYVQGFELGKVVKK
jgi:hypothetical protein